MKLIFILLNNGSKIVAELKSEDDQSIFIENPLEIIVFEDMTGQKGFTYDEWLPNVFMEENPIKLKHSSILTTVNPSEELIEFYNNVLKTRKEEEPNKIHIGNTPPVNISKTYEIFLKNLPEKGRTVH